MSSTDDENDRLEEMLRQAAVLEAQMKSSGSQRSRSSQDVSDQSRQSSIWSERESVSRSGTSSSGVGGGTADAPVDDMLRQAELLSQKMRSSSHQSYAETALEDSQDESVDEMLRKAELLSIKMTEQSSPARRSKPAVPVENTPALIRKSERILSTMYHNEQSSVDVSTPDLMWQTEHLLGKMKASRTQDSGEENVARSSDVSSNPDASIDAGMNSEQSTDSCEVPLLDQRVISSVGKETKASQTQDPGAGESVARSSDLMLSTPEESIVRMKSEQPSDSNDVPLTDQQTTRSFEQEKTRSQELKRLMEQALSSWTGSPEEKGRVKNALDQIVPSLESTPHTPSTVSIQLPDEMSSVGSQSPRTNRSHRSASKRAKSLLESAERPPLPRHSQDTSAAVERARNMAIALQETISRSSSDAEDNAVEAADRGDEPIEEPPMATAPTGLQPLLPQSPPRSAKRNTPPRSAKRNTPPRSAKHSTPPRSVKRNTTPSSTSHPQRKPVAPLEKKRKRKSGQSSSKPSFKPDRNLVSSEEAQYNAIMAAIDSSGSGPVSWERLDSAAVDDDDYVPLADYSRKASKRSRTAVSFDIRVMGRTSRGRGRGRKVGRILIAFLLFLVAGVAMKLWFSRGIIQDTHQQNDVDDEPDLLEEDVEEASADTGHFDDEPAFELLVEKLLEQERINERIPVTDRWVSVESNAVAIIPKRTMREKVVTTAKRVRKWVLHFAVFLTPPWERFCSGDARACRDTNHLVNSLSSS